MQPGLDSVELVEIPVALDGERLKHVDLFSGIICILD